MVFLLLRNIDAFISLVYQSIDYYVVCDIKIKKINFVYQLYLSYWDTDFYKLMIN